MANVTCIAPIESISGKLAKRHDVVFNVRKSANALGERKNYTSMPIRGTYAPTEGQKQQAHRFGLIGKKVAQYRLGANFADMKAAFKAQSTYKTLQQYLWHTAAAEIDNNA